MPRTTPEGTEVFYVTDVGRRKQRRRPPRIKEPKEVYTLMRPRVAALQKEHFYVLLLDTKNQVLCIQLVSIGSLNASIVHPREILKYAMGCETCDRPPAASVLLVHNHPTGDPAPSREDIEFTKRFAKCGELMGIQLLDHVIIGDGQFQSLKEAGHF